MKLRLVILASLLLGLFWPVEARAQSEQRYAVIVQGTSAGEPYASTYRKWLTGLVGALREKLGFDAARITVLSDQPAAGEQLANAENVKTAFSKLAEQAREGDLVFVLLMGHGGGDGADAKFNLVGPDLTVIQWSAMLSPIKARVAFINTSGGSYPYLKGLSAPGRVVITATGTAAQRYDTVFPEFFIQALTAGVTDADKNGRISLLEAYVYATNLVAEYYEQKGQLSTENAVFNDTGDGTPQNKFTPGAAVGTVAGLTYFNPAVVATSSDPALQQLLTQQKTLTDQIDELRRRRPSMTREAFEQEFEKLIIELSLVSRDVRRKSGG